MHKAQIFHDDHGSLLHIACCSLKVDMVYWLLHNGFLPTEMDANYNTPLHNLVENGPNHETVNVLRIARMLIDKGAMTDCALTCKVKVLYILLLSAYVNMIQLL